MGWRRPCSSSVRQDWLQYTQFYFCNRQPLRQGKDRLLAAAIADKEMMYVSLSPQAFQSRLYALVTTIYDLSWNLSYISTDFFTPYILQLFKWLLYSWNDSCVLVWVRLRACVWVRVRGKFVRKGRMSESPLFTPSWRFNLNLCLSFHSFLKGIMPHSCVVSVRSLVFWRPLLVWVVF